MLTALAGGAAVEYNKGAVMVLPPGATKGTGLQFALDELGYSPHNVVAVGDAENDRSLFEVAEVSVAVANANWSRRQRLLDLGQTLDESPLQVDPSLLTQGNVAIVGASATGKSWLAGLLTELLLERGYQVCVIDPEGDYRGLRAFPHTLVLGGWWAASTCGGCRHYD